MSFRGQPKVTQVAPILLPNLLHIQMCVSSYGGIIAYELHEYHPDGIRVIREIRVLLNIEILVFSVEYL